MNKVLRYYVDVIADSKETNHSFLLDISSALRGHIVNVEFAYVIPSAEVSDVCKPKMCAECHRQIGRLLVMSN